MTDHSVRPRKLLSYTLESHHDTAARDSYQPQKTTVGDPIVRRACEGSQALVGKPTVIRLHRLLPLPFVLVALLCAACAAQAPDAEAAREAPSPEVTDTTTTEHRVLTTAANSAAAQPQRPPRRASIDTEERRGRSTIENESSTIGQCPWLRGGRPPRIASIGSSTMVGLSWVMKKDFEQWGVEQLRLAKPSTGLARPDFYDWPSEAASIRDKHDPDIWLAVLGTNDNQGLRLSPEERQLVMTMDQEAKSAPGATKKKKKRKRTPKWVRPKHAAWPIIYAQRLDRLLHAMSPKGRRTIILIGPSKLDRGASKRIAPVINRLMKERIAAFDGPAYFIDAYHAGLSPSGKILKKIQIPGTRKWVKARGGDGIHLTLKGLRWLLAEPVYQRLRPCLLAAKKGPLPRRNDPLLLPRESRQGLAPAQ